MESPGSFLGRERLLPQKNGRSMKQEIQRTKKQKIRNHPARGYLFIIGALVVSLLFMLIVSIYHLEIDQRAQTTSRVAPTFSTIEDCNTMNACPTGTAIFTSPSRHPPTSGPPGMQASTDPQSSGTSSLEPSGQTIPADNVPGWKLLFADDFSGTVPLGAFSNCSSTQTPQQARCTGLQSYGNYYNNWWAYPTGWPDTAKSRADGNTGAPYGGVYHPEDTVSVSNGAMHIHMYRPTTGGDNHVATVVPIPCMNHQYGRYTERLKVTRYAPGFKSAHLFYEGGFEIDYPENDYGTTMSAYTHPGEANFSTAAKWTDWHTTVIEWTPGQIKFYMDGSLVGTTTTQVSNIAMDWILQNESSIRGPYAANGASSQLDIDWVACYAPAS